MIRALRYEWVRLVTIRSTWYYVVAAVILGGFFAYISTVFQESPIVTRSLTIPLTIAATTIAFVLSMLGVASFGQEYRDGTIRVTLTAFSSRWKIVVAKALVTSVFVFVCTFVTCLALLLLVIFAYGFRNFAVPVEFAPLLIVAIQIALYSALSALLGLGFAGILRDSTAPVILLITLPLLVEPILEFVGARSQWSGAAYLPFTAGMRLFNQGDWKAGLVFAAYALVSLTVCWLLLRSRDVQ